jgi:predicted dehydrogenase
MFRWGVLGVSNFATNKMIPAIQAGHGMQVTAIASRDPARAEATARALGIPRFYGSYDALLADPGIDGVYVPLPNHLHVPWSIRAAEAGKHVLCEKPIALHAAEARRLVDARDRCGVLIQEAAMVRLHPRWLAVRELIRKGKIGELRAVVGQFAYNLPLRDNVRYRPEMGGGTLLDVGFYPVTISRFCFDGEPLEAAATFERDPEAGVDRLVAGTLRFPRGVATFACGMQLAPYQRVDLLGTLGHLEVPIAFNPMPDAACQLVIDTGPHLEDMAGEPVHFDACNQYTILAELFARAAADGRPAPLPLEDSVRNMAALDALFRSAGSGRWEAVDPTA